MKTCEIKGCNRKYFTKELCKKHYGEQYREEHKEYYVKYGKQYRQEHKEEKKKYHIDNKEHIAIKAKLYRENHKEHLAEWNKQYRIDNKEHKREYMKQWLKTPAGKASRKAKRHNRRIALRGLTKAIIQSVYEDNIKKYGTLTCILCNKPIEFSKDSLEHLTPLSRGGSNDYDNLGIAHRSCNKRKHTKTMEEWKCLKKMC